ncbi:unnamed protein product [Lactuca saligna]|uniref:Uncharacterized protein n=1 Tax=Lactuca saligna TaxID=75948 RepID=A0AA35Y7C5_LACSI|nr:unnamed protein product [Lactuca saligna]
MAAATMVSCRQDRDSDSAATNRAEGGSVTMIATLKLLRRWQQQHNNGSIVVLPQVKKRPQLSQRSQTTRPLPWLLLRSSATPPVAHNHHWRQALLGGVRQRGCKRRRKEGEGCAAAGNRDREGGDCSFLLRIGFPYTYIPTSIH